jgi:hypothetical protein
MQDISINLQNTEYTVNNIPVAFFTEPQGSKSLLFGATRPKDFFATCVDKAARGRVSSYLGSLANVRLQVSHAIQRRLGK